MKRLYASHNPVALMQIGDALRQADIAFLHRNASMTGQAAGELTPIVCWPEIWVMHDEDYEAARQIAGAILERHDNPGETWVCETCGETLEGQFGSCWQCAARLTDEE